MEPLAAFGLAAGIFQIIDFSIKVLSTGHQIYESGSTVRSSEYTLATDDLSSLNDKIKLWARPDATTMGPLTDENQALENLAHKCACIVDELIAVLFKIQMEGNVTKFKSFRLAIASMWNKSKIDEIAKRLEAIRSELQFHIIVSMKETVDNIALRKDIALPSFNQATATIVKSILDGNAELAAVVAAQNDDLIRRKKTNDTAALRRHEETLAAIKSLPHALGQTITTDQTMSPQVILDNIKARLDFDRMSDRFDDIAQAHMRTFEWVFQDTIKRQDSWSNFHQWLRKENGVYWISGKAGSGKSTLMKFLNQDSRLKESLKLWSGNTPLVLTSFYFWNAGTDLQKSQRGLFRSILSEALSQNPDLAPILFPDRYQLGASWVEFPTFHQLRRAFEKLTKQAHIPIKLVLLIDGLDEFEATDATMIELAEIFLIASQSKNVKAILSSRPLSAFEAAFADRPKLRLHDLTQKDINTFVDDKLGQHPRMIELAQDDATGTESLIAEIVSSASGVFLWVKLVVRSLLEGLQNYDELEVLYHRLRKLPRDLEDLFMHMLRKIPDEYKSHSSRIFQLVRCTDSPKANRWGYYHPENSFTAMSLHFTEYSLETILEARIVPISSSELQRRQKEIDGRLRSHCAGLIELRTRSRSSIEDGGKGRVEEQGLIEASREAHEKSLTKDGGETQQCENAVTEAEVQYLHKSVADFLRKGHVWEEIVEGTKSTSFDPHILVLQSWVMRLKCSPIDLESDGRISQEQLLQAQWSLVYDCVHFAQLAEQSTGTAQDEILDEMDKTMSTFLERVREANNNLEKCEHFTNWCDTLDHSTKSILHSRNTFLSYATQSGLRFYVEAKIRKQGKGILKKEGRPLLHYACKFDGQEHAFRHTTVDLELIRLLLENGADPNDKFNGFSPFQHALYSDIKDPIYWKAVIKLLVWHGADPQDYIELLEMGRLGLPYHELDDASLCFRRENMPLILKEYISSIEFSNLNMKRRRQYLGAIATLKIKGVEVEECSVRDREEKSRRKRTLLRRARWQMKDLFKWL